jgi:uncharacterized protein
VSTATITKDAVGATVLTPHMYYYGSRLSERITQTPEGYLICRDVPIARTGWQEYTADEIGAMGDSQTRVRVYRSPDEVFSPAAIASFEGKSVTNQHPPEFLTTANFSAYHRGHVQNVRASHLTDSDGERLLLADLVVMDALLISEIENGKREISCGYSCDYQRVSDKSQNYMQTQIRGNHIAVVSSARAGSDVRIYDAAKPKEDEMPEPNNTVNDGGLSVFQSVLKFMRDEMGWGPQRRTADAESEAVTRNAEVNAEARKRHETIAKDMKKVRSGDDDDDCNDDDDWKRKITDRLNALDAKFGKTKDDDDDDDDEVPEEEEKEEAKDDHDFVPVETLSGNEIPHNPLTSDSKTVEALRKMKPLIAKHGTIDQRRAFNAAMRALKGKTTGDSPYRALSKTKKPEEIESAETRASLMQTDATKKAQDAAKQFVDAAKKYHKKNIDSVQ